MITTYHAWLVVALTEFAKIEEAYGQCGLPSPYQEYRPSNSSWIDVEKKISLSYVKI